MKVDKWRHGNETWPFTTAVCFIRRPPSFYISSIWREWVGVQPQGMERGWHPLFSSCWSCRWKVVKMNPVLEQVSCGTLISCSNVLCFEVCAKETANTSNCSNCFSYSTKLCIIHVICGSRFAFFFVIVHSFFGLCTVSLFWEIATLLRHIPCCMGRMKRSYHSFFSFFTHVFWWKKIKMKMIAVGQTFGGYMRFCNVSCFEIFKKWNKSNYKKCLPLPGGILDPSDSIPILTSVGAIF